MTAYSIEGRFFQHYALNTELREAFDETVTGEGDSSLASNGKNKRNGKRGNGKNPPKNGRNTGKNTGHPGSENLIPWKPGDPSPNPAGRPKGSLSLTSILRNVLNEKSDDKESKLTKAQELIATMFKNAKAGDARILSMVMDRIDGKVPDILVGGLGFGALEELPGELLDKIIDAGEKAKNGKS